VQHRGEPRDDRLAAVGLAVEHAAVDGHDERGLVRCEGLALVVDDGAARRLAHHLAHPVALRRHLVAAVLENLQRPQPEEQHGECGEDDDAQHVQPKPRV
jgi:hypothetical protein